MNIRANLGFWLVVPLFLFGFSVNLYPSDFEYYVASNGDDGKPGTEAQPFRTISRACLQMTPRYGGSSVGGVTIWIREGIYRETVRPLRSGTADAPIRFIAYPGEEPIVSGANILDVSWTLHSGKIYKASTTVDFEQLFVDGQMMQEARWPNTPTRDLIRARYAICDDGTNADVLVDDALPQGDWDGAIAYIRAFPGWSYNRKLIRNYKPGESFEFTVSGWPDSRRDTRPGDRYWLVGALAGLDRATEWFFDIGTRSVYIWCPGNPDPSHHTIEVKQRKHAFDLSNRQHISIEGLLIFAAGILMEASSYCSVDNCHLKYPVHESTNHSPPTTNYMTGNSNRWSDSIIAFSSGHGIEDKGAYNQVTNCIIHDWDYDGRRAGGIKSTEATRCDYTYNTIYNGGGSGINAYIASYLNIGHNHIYNCGALTKESGLIWAGWTNPGGTIIAYNRVHDNLDEEDGDGISLEHDTRYYTVHHNLVWNVSSVGLVVRVPSLYNEIYNNTILPSCKTAIAVGTDSANYRGTRFINNIANGPIEFTSDMEFPEQHHNGYHAVDAKGWPTTGSGAIDTGEVIPGITDGYTGSAPDIGCFEVGTEAWQAGADWEETEFTRIPRNFEGFETGDFAEFEWIKSPQWMITSDDANSGFYSAHCTGLTNDEHSTMEVMVKCHAGEIMFHRKVSSGEAIASLELTIDGESMGQWSGNLDWENVSFPVTEGTHTFTWTYSKINGFLTHNDGVWIDDIEFPIDSLKVVEEPCIRRVTNTEGFETGDFLQFGWVRPYQTGDPKWTITSKDKNSGFYSAYSSASIADDTFLKVFLECRAGNITFYRKTASSKHAGLRFDIDGESMGQWKGNLNWKKVAFPVTEGLHTFTWNQFRTPWSTTEVDIAWIDDIEFPISAESDTGEPPVKPTSNPEGFETGDFTGFDWAFYGYTDWRISTGEHHSGTYSARAGFIGDGEDSTLQVTLNCIDGQVAFFYKVSSEPRWDWLKFYIDGAEKGRWSGEQDWTEVSYPVASGERSFTWTYSKDESSSDGSDTAWIDDIIFPIHR